MRTEWYPEQVSPVEPAVIAQDAAVDALKKVQEFDELIACWQRLDALRLTAFTRCDKSVIG